MSFLPNFLYDIFVCHDPAFSITHQHLVKSIVGDLQDDIRYVDADMAQLSVFIDLDPPSFGLPFSQILSANVEKSATLLIIAEPAILASDTLQAILERFSQSRGEGWRESVFLVRVMPIADHQWPAILRDEKGYPAIGFQLTDHVTGLPLNADKSSAPYIEALYTISTAYIRYLRELFVASNSAETPLAIPLSQTVDTSKAEINPYNGQGPFAFISYKREELDRMHYILTPVINAGYDIWFDSGILGSTTWAGELVKKIRQSGCFIPMLSAKSIVSPNMRREINIAGKYSVPILPIYMEQIDIPDELLYYLSDVQGLFSDRPNFRNDLLATFASLFPKQP